MAFPQRFTPWSAKRNKNFANPYEAVMNQKVVQGVFTHPRKTEFGEFKVFIHIITHDEAMNNTDAVIYTTDEIV